MNLELYIIINQEYMVLPLGGTGVRVEQEAVTCGKWVWPMDEKAGDCAVIVIMFVASQNKTIIWKSVNLII